MQAYGVFGVCSRGSLSMAISERTTDRDPLVSPADHTDARLPGPTKRFVLRPWRWMLIVHEYDAHADRVVVPTIQDSRSSSTVTSG